VSAALGTSVGVGLPASVMVPVPVRSLPLAATLADRLDRVTPKTSLPSLRKSSAMGTLKVVLVAPVAMVPAPLLAL
jgi:hypothetical protein